MLREQAKLFNRLSIGVDILVIFASLVLVGVSVRDHEGLAAWRALVLGERCHRARARARARARVYHR